MKRLLFIVFCTFTLFWLGDVVIIGLQTQKQLVEVACIAGDELEQHSSLQRPRGIMCYVQCKSDLWWLCLNDDWCFGMHA